MNDLPPLAPIEKVDMPLNFAFRVGMPAFVLWWTLQWIDADAFTRRFAANAAVFCLLWAVQKRLFRTPEGDSVFAQASAIAGIPDLSPSGLPGYRFLVCTLRTTVPAAVLAFAASTGPSFTSLRTTLNEIKKFNNIRSVPSLFGMLDNGLSIDHPMVPTRDCPERRMGPLPMDTAAA